MGFPVLSVGVPVRGGQGGLVVAVAVGGVRSSAGRTAVCRRVVAVEGWVHGPAVAGSLVGGLPVVVVVPGGAVAVSALTG